jgi:hypothetical protein
VTLAAISGIFDQMPNGQDAKFIWQIYAVILYRTRSSQTYGSQKLRSFKPDNLTISEWRPLSTAHDPQKFSESEMDLKEFRSSNVPIYEINRRKMNEMR